MATCLQIIQSVAKRIGIPSPNTVVSSQDPQIIQIAELSNEEGQEQAARYQWQNLLQEASFTTLAAELQGTMATIAPGMNYILNDTIWNRTLRRPVFGPRTPQSWQQQKAFAINGPWSSFRVKGDELYMYPTPTAGQSCYFEYISKNWCESTVNITYASWSADTDVSLLDERLMILGTVWRWKAAKGLEYAEDFAKYERALADVMGRDGSKDWINLSNTKYDIYPGVVVPAGSWSL